MEILEKNEKTKRVFYPQSILNQELPLWLKWTLFAVGFAGLQLLSLVFSVFFLNSTLDMNLINSILMFSVYLVAAVIVVLLVFFLRKQTFLKCLKEFTQLKTYGFALAVFGAMVVLNYIINLLYLPIPFYGDNNNQESVVATTMAAPALMFFPLAIFAPLLEELTYRAGLMDAIGSKNRTLGILCSALIFGLIHFDWTTILGVAAQLEGYTKEMAINELLNLPSYILSGALLGFAYAKTGRISTSIGGHSLNNLLSFVSVFLA